MQTKETTYRAYIQAEFGNRKARNPAYSLRAFARDLGLAAPKLSQILNGSCGLSGSSAKRVAAKLGLSQAETEFFVALVECQHSRSKTGKKQAHLRAAELRETKFSDLDLERFRIIADWYHFALLELTEVEDFRSDRKWIARRLGISLEQVNTAIQRLLDHGLLEQDSKGRIKQTHSRLFTPSGIPSRELRAHHSQILRKAEASLEAVSVAEREFSASTLAIDPSQMEDAKRALREFRRKFCKEVQEKKPARRVYCLSIQFFPLDEGENKIGGRSHE